MKTLKLITVTICLGLIMISSGCSLGNSTKDIINDSSKAFNKIETYHADIRTIIKTTTDNTNPIMVEGITELEDGKESGHSISNINIESLDNTRTTKIDTYYDYKNQKEYIKNSNFSNYIETENKTNYRNLINIGKHKKSAKAFKLQKKDKQYILSASFKKLKNKEINVDNFVNGVKNTKIKSGNIRYVINNKTNLIEKVLIEKLTLVGEADSNKKVEIELNISIEISDCNNLEKNDYEIPNNIIKNKVEQNTNNANVEVKGNSTYLLSEKELNNNNCFVVGEDIPYGEYEVSTDGDKTTVTIYNFQTLEEKAKWIIGFDIEEDNFKKKEQITLNNGDEIYISGEATITFSKN